MSVAIRRSATFLSLALAASFGTVHAQVTVHLTTTTQATCDITTDANGLRLGSNGTDLSATGVTLSGTGCGGGGGGGGGAPAPNNFALVALPAAPVTGTPFTVSWLVTGATSCAGVATLNGSAVTLTGWTDVATAVSPRTVDATAAGTYVLALTCSNTAGSVTSTPVSVVVSQGAVDSCPIAPRTRATHSNIKYLPNSGTRTAVDLTDWNQIWGLIDPSDTLHPWPGSQGASPTITTIGKTQYVAAKFHVGAEGASLSGVYNDVSYGSGPPIDAAISTVCGDFSPADPACHVTSVASQDQSFLAWKMAPGNAAHCGLQPNTDYYFNFQFHDANPPGPGCSGDTCEITIQNFHN